MKNTIKLFGFIALVAVIGFSFAACGGDDDGGGGGQGTFTLTDIPSKYNGKYALLVGEGGEDETYTYLYGCLSWTESPETFTLPQISNGSVSLPMWKVTSDEKLVKYSGNNSCGILVGIFNSQTWDGEEAIVDVYFEPVPFSKGSATKSWNNGIIE
jgi:hypothetical protein